MKALVIESTVCKNSDGQTLALEVGTQFTISDERYNKKGMVLPTEEFGILYFEENVLQTNLMVCSESIMQEFVQTDFWKCHLQKHQIPQSLIDEIFYKPKNHYINFDIIKNNNNENRFNDYFPRLQESFYLRQNKH